jgi:hypothetical protein
MTTTRSDNTQSIVTSADSRRSVVTFCNLRLGDNLAHLHFMRSLAKAYPSIHFVHGAMREYLPQLVDVVCDLPNLQLMESAHVPAGAINAWKNDCGYWERNPLRNSYAPFMLEWFGVLAARMGLDCPLTKPSDLLFDYPALERQYLGAKPFDVLLVNSPALSGQFRGYHENLFFNLCSDMQRAGLSVWATERVDIVNCTKDCGLNVTQIGQLSQFARCIIAVSTGPSWPTFNVWNVHIPRLLLIDHERLDGIVPNIRHSARIDDAREYLRELKMLP